MKFILTHWEVLTYKTVSGPMRPRTVWFLLYHHYCWHQMLVWCLWVVKSLFQGCRYLSGKSWLGNRLWKPYFNDLMQILLIESYWHFLLWIYICSSSRMKICHLMLLLDHHSVLKNILLSFAVICCWSHSIKPIWSVQSGFNNIICIPCW